MNWKKHVHLLEDFNHMLSVLRDHGYLFETTIRNTKCNSKNTYYKEAYSKKNSVLRIMSMTPTPESHYSGYILADNALCFNKWSQAPVVLPIPSNDDDMGYLIECLEWLKTEEGYNVSNSFDFDQWKTYYPGKEFHEFEYNGLNVKITFDKVCFCNNVGNVNFSLNKYGAVYFNGSDQFILDYYISSKLFRIFCDSLNYKSKIILNLSQYVICLNGGISFFNDNTLYFSIDSLGDISYVTSMKRDEHLYDSVSKYFNL
jgi:hypothetical protein